MKVLLHRVHPSVPDPDVAWWEDASGRLHEVVLRPDPVSVNTAREMANVVPPPKTRDEWWTYLAEGYSPFEDWDYLDVEDPEAFLASLAEGSSHG